MGEKIDHVDGMTVEEAEHQLATRLYQNTAKVHFNQHSEAQGRFGRRLIYGGHVISLARALSFNGLANAFHIAAINGGRHVAPLFAGGTVFAWSEIIETAELPGPRRRGRAAHRDAGDARCSVCGVPGGGRRAGQAGGDPGAGLLGADGAVSFAAAPAQSLQIHLAPA